MAIEDLTTWFENIRNPSEGVDPDTIVTNISQVYQDDISIRDAAVKARETELAEQREANRILKEKNYDLLMSQPAGNVSTGNGDTKPDTDDESERAASITFADIFKQGEK